MQLEMEYKVKTPKHNESMEEAVYNVTPTYATQMITHALPCKQPLEGCVETN